MSWIFWASMAALFAALTAVFAKIGVAQINSDLATLVRTALVLVILGPFVILSGKWSNPLLLPARGLTFLTLSAVATGASWLCYFRALQSGPASLVSSIDKLSVVLVALLAFAILRERPTPLAWLGIVMVGTGTALIVWSATRSL